MINRLSSGELGYSILGENGGIIAEEASLIEANGGNVININGNFDVWFNINLLSASSNEFCGNSRLFC